MDKKILLIEDEEPLRFLYTRQFQGANLQVDAFGTGQEGLTALETNFYNLALVDIMLPDINGIEILKKLNEKNLVQKSPIVLLTNLAQDDIIKEGFSLGIIGYLIKAQYKPQELVNEVMNFLQNTKYTPPLNPRDPSLA